MLGRRTTNEQTNNQMKKRNSNSSSFEHHSIQVRQSTMARLTRIVHAMIGREHQAKKFNGNIHLEYI